MTLPEGFRLVPVEPLTQVRWFIHDSTISEARTRA